MDKKQALLRPEDGGQSSSSSGTDTTRTRYKPLAPKTPGTSASPPEFEDEPLPAADLTFVNFTDPLQSKSQESRKLVRTQVMRNFAREQKKQKARAEAGSEGSTSTPAAATTTFSGQSRVAARPSGSSMGEALRPRSARRGSHPAPQRAPRIAMTPSVPGGSPLVWPVIMESHDEELKRHCCSHSFRASNPLYMISLLADRPGASRYPLMVDIDSIADVSNADLEQNLLYRLAESSASLAHAIMMVSASDLALRQVNKATSDRLVIYHKSRVLALLNEAIQDVQSSGSLETLATAAVLACHELVVGDYKAWTVHILGFSRMIAMNGGINSLERENPVRRLILWSDQVGALFMNMRPLFPASAVFASTTSRLTQTLSQSITKAYSRGGFEGVPSWLRLQAEGKLSENLLSVMEDIELVAFTGAQAIIEDIGISVETLVDLRDSVIHRLLYLAPESQDGDDEYSFEECARLAMILITLDRLFSPVLPGAYFQLTHMVADRLASLIADRNLAEDWVAHEWAALWICFIGAGVSTNNPSTRSSFIGAGAPLCRVLFRGPEEMDRELEAGLRPYARVPTLHGSELFGAFVGDLKERISAL